MDSSSSSPSGVSSFWHEFRETVKTLVVAIVFAFVFRSFAYEPFHIPSDSMKSNLLVGDYLFVSKFSYGYSRYSLPFWGWPHMPGRYMENHTPQRGDIVVFRPPGNASEDFIKRLIGLPGDHIQMKNGILFLNGKPLPKDYMDEWTDSEPDGRAGQGSITYRRFRETLPDGKSYYILNGKGMGQAENTPEFVVPPKHYFMMGDNRDDSRDSRYLGFGDGIVGYVPEENLVGRADIIMFSWNGTFGVRTNRFFQMIP